MNIHIRQKLAAITTGLALIVGAVVLNAAPVTAAASPPTNLRVTDLRFDGFTVAWDEVAGASHYFVSAGAMAPPVGTPPAITTAEPAATFDNLIWDTHYGVWVWALVSNSYTQAATTAVTTPLPDGYHQPTAPANLRAERDAQGRLERFRWDASAGGHGTLNYRFHLESPGFLRPAIWFTTTGLTVDADDLPVCDGCEYDPSQTIIVWVTAKDRRHTSPPSDRVALTCCPF